MCLECVVIVIHGDDRWHTLIVRYNWGTQQGNKTSTRRVRIVNEVFSLIDQIVFISEVSPHLFQCVRDGLLSQGDAFVTIVMIQEAFITGHDICGRKHSTTMTKEFAGGTFFGTIGVRTSLGFAASAAAADQT